MMAMARRGLKPTMPRRSARPSAKVRCQFSPVFKVSRRKAGGFGFVMPSGSPLTETFNRSLLGVIESGRFDDLHDQWFGAAPDGN